MAITWSRHQGKAVPGEAWAAKWRRPSNQLPCHEEGGGSQINQGSNATKEGDKEGTQEGGLEAGVAAYMVASWTPERGLKITRKVGGPSWKRRHAAGSSSRKGEPRLRSLKGGSVLPIGMLEEEVPQRAQGRGAREEGIKTELWWDVLQGKQPTEGALYC
ncbi:hypothetical protein GOP47_0012161 [Adiantum capillus-veneris]|uniref:Uncharacterized protein n=1 Tax=Adiantum capillus-veneris TaxID=13818 RepID=A0A9D4ZG91_ADICA|nr:hypothetical protein GOP47_0012161 [Adiantum capillus-veneris]